jgi:hypothetical protein
MTHITQTGTPEQRRGVKLTTVIPIRIKYRGGRKVIIPAAPSADKTPTHDAPILKALARAFHWQHLIDEGIVNSGAKIARQEGVNATTVNELLRLTLLSPTLISRILAGQQPKTLSIHWLKNNMLPSDWDEQHALFDVFDA